MCQRNFKTGTVNKITQWAHRQTLADRQTRKHRSNIEEATAQPATLHCRALAEWLTKFLFIKGDRSLINRFCSLLQHVSHQFSLITSVSATASHSHLSPGTPRSPSVFSCSQCQMLSFTSSSITKCSICIKCSATLALEERLRQLEEPLCSFGHKSRPITTRISIAEEELSRPCVALEVAGPTNSLTQQLQSSWERAAGWLLEGSVAPKSPPYTTATVWHCVHWVRPPPRLYH